MSERKVVGQADGTRMKLLADRRVKAQRAHILS